MKSLSPSSVVKSSTFIAAVLAVLASASQVRAAESSKWTALLERAGQQGTSQDTPNGEMRTLTQEDPASDPSAPSKPVVPHRVEYFSVVGGVESTGHFGVGHVGSPQPSATFSFPPVLRTAGGLLTIGAMEGCTAT